MPERQQEKLLANLDKDGDGKIDIQEFRQLFIKKDSKINITEK